MIKELYLNNLQKIDFDKWLYSSAKEDADILCFAVSGYEERCTKWTESTKNVLRQKAKWKVFGFKELNNVLSRPKSDEFYKDNNCEINQYSRENAIDIMQSIRDEVCKYNIEKRKSLHVHIDYSCMPRNWYCNIPKVLEQTLRPQDTAFFWYSAGFYDTGNYPTAGVGDFKVFAGKPSLGARFRAHLFGLGFDKIRAHAIWSVMDPQYLVCFYADPGVMVDYVKKVTLDNEDILRQANMNIKLPINDFSITFSRLHSLVCEFHDFGDVVLVPDGPKPLVFASSLIPLFFGKPGAVCFHVSRGKSSDHRPVDVKPTGEVYGFKFNGNLCR